jgi:hypothetical protein
VFRISGAKQALNQAICAMKAALRLAKSTIRNVLKRWGFLPFFQGRQRPIPALEKSVIRRPIPGRESTALAILFCTEIVTRLMSATPHHLAGIDVKNLA